MSDFEFNDASAFLAISSFLLWKWNKAGVFTAGNDVPWYQQYRGSVPLSPGGTGIGLLLVLDYIMLFLIGYIFLREFNPPVVTNSLYTWVFLFYYAHVILDKLWLVLFFDAGSLDIAFLTTLISVATGIVLLVLVLAGGAASLLAPLIVTIILRIMRTIITLLWARLRRRVGFPTNRRQAEKKEQERYEQIEQEGGKWVM